MKNSHKNKEKMISEKFEKSLNDWKLPPFSARNIFEPRGCCYWFVDCKVNTVNEEIPLKKGSATFTLFSKHRERALQNDCRFVHVVMIQVGLKPTKLGSDTSAKIHLRDMRLKKFDVSVLAKAESSLCDGPIYFYYFPAYCVDVSDSCKSFSIDVEINGDERITLMYRFYYQLKIGSPSERAFSRRVPVDERGKTTLYVVDVGRGKRVVSKTMEWDQIGKCGGNAGEKGGANVDWKETAKGHVLQVDVPGFKKEEVKIEVEDGGVLQISAERSNDEEEESEKWHCKERRSEILRRLRLPENADLDEMEACMENGVLTITVPKEEGKPKKPVKIIEISG